MKVLVTGADGQLGNEIRNLANQFPEWQFLFTDVDSLDVTCKEKVQLYFREKKPEFVVNCAAYTAVDKAETENDKAHQINALAPEILAHAAKQFHSCFIHISTDYVFNGDSFLPYSETDEENPDGVYGKTKREGELRCLAQKPETIIIRTSWLYSAFGNNFVKTMLRLGSERDFLEVVFDQVGTPTYAADLANAVFSVIETFEKGTQNYAPGIYHFSNEGVASWYDFAKGIFELSELSCRVEPVLSDAFPTLAKRPHFSVLNKSKIKSTFNLKIPYWRDSLKICLGKIQKNK
jgi:dTDP-4-dehydrorhamnose reductase